MLGLSLLTASLVLIVSSFFDLFFLLSKFLKSSWSIIQFGICMFHDFVILSSISFTLWDFEINLGLWTYRFEPTSFQFGRCVFLLKIKISTHLA